MPGQDINLHTLCESSQLSPWTGWGREESSLFEDMQNCWTGRNHLANDMCCDWTSPRLGQVSVVSCRQLWLTQPKKPPPSPSCLMTFSITCSGLLCVTISEAHSELERQKNNTLNSGESNLEKCWGSFPNLPQVQTVLTLAGKKESNFVIFISSFLILGTSPVCLDEHALSVRSFTDT